MRWNLRFKRSKPNVFSAYIISDSHLNIEAIDDPSFPNLSSPPMYYYTMGQKLKKFVDVCNQDKPDLVYHMGDIIDSRAPNDSFDVFMSYWNQIESYKKLTIGNHDCGWRRGENEYGLNIHDYCAKKLGYEENTLKAGSKFNESFTLSAKGTTVKFINFDTNINEQGEHTSDTDHLPQNIINWIESELLNSTTNNVVLLAHKGDYYFNDIDRGKMYSMISDVLAQKQNMRITFVFGHSHRNVLNELYPNIERFRIYNVPAVVDLNPGKFIKMFISPNGDVSFRVGNVFWSK